jgi:hypothetical protein
MDRVDSGIDMDYFHIKQHVHNIPPKSPTDTDGSDDEDLDTFFDTYIPLSNFPTPPPSSVSVCLPEPKDACPSQQHFMGMFSFLFCRQH